MKNKLISVGDTRGAEIIDIILRDEIGHVRIGNKWYRHLCDERGIDPVTAFAELTRRYEAPRLRGPFNLDARRAAGFTDEELAKLARPTYPGGARTLRSGT